MKVALKLLLVYLLLSCHTTWADTPPAWPTNAPVCIELHDQFNAPQKLSFPAPKAIVLAIADRKGSEEVNGWITALKPLYGTRVEFRGLANVAGVPGFFQGRLRRKFQETVTYPVMMDWSGTACGRFGYQRQVANILVIDRGGTIHARICGRVTPAGLASARAALEEALAAPDTKPSSSLTSPGR